MRNRRPGGDTAAVVLSFLLLDFLANNALCSRTIPSAAGASVHFGGFVVGDLHVTEILRITDFPQVSLLRFTPECCLSIVTVVTSTFV